MFIHIIFIFHLLVGVEFQFQDTNKLTNTSTTTLQPTQQPETSLIDYITTSSTRLLVLLSNSDITTTTTNKQEREIGTNLRVFEMSEFRC
jgi:hypothetical protein